jgi:RNA polymerase sigma-70 factor, ECF subfamily
VSGHYKGVDRRVRFELIYDEHAVAVKSYVLRRADAVLADDVVAEVFVVCWRRLEELPPDALPWLLGVARRVLSTQRRGERRRVALRERLRVSSEPAAGALQPGGDGALKTALASLSDEDRELLLLIAWDGVTPSAAALILDIKPATARVRLLRARRRLSEALDRAESAPLLRRQLPMEAPR